jgi:HD-GYP domain-containing protein (c-di-GMP phosphodiesterase class II)
MDGLGYPDGLHAAEVCVGARIAGVADAYDAMTRPRVFRDAITPGNALLELERCSGTQFDPLIVEALSRVMAAL